MSWIVGCSLRKSQVKQQLLKPDKILHVTKTVSGNWHNVLKWICSTGLFELRADFAFLVVKIYNASQSAAIYNIPPTNSQSTVSTSFKIC